MVKRGANFQQMPVNICGSSVFGKYAKISTERTWNMYISDNFLVPYAGYIIAILAKEFDDNSVGRACFYSVKLNALVVVISNQVYTVEIVFDQATQTVSSYTTQSLGKLLTNTGVVYVTENNKPQILLSDGNSLYLYDPAVSFRLSIVTGLSFTPGYITFHDGYFIAAASNNTFYSPPAKNTWILSAFNDGSTWEQTSSTVGLLSSKPDNVQAVVRFPSKGNMILVMGKTVTETWFNTGAQLFPYQRTNQFNIDYGCLSPATVAYMDEIVVWLAANEKSGPIIMYSNGGMPQQITTDGIDFQFSQLQYPESSQGFLFRQDGHLFYHINFYKDNFSYFYDFNSKKFFNASDQDLNYFIAAQVAFADNQYYFVSRNTGNLYAFGTLFNTYEDTLQNNAVVTNEIPRIRICHNMRLPSQDYFVANDIGFTIESGDTNYQQQSAGPLYLITQDGNDLISQGISIYFQTQDGFYLQTQDSQYITSQQTDTSDYYYLIANQDDILYTTPAVDMSISTDGGAVFGNEWRYDLPAIGLRKNRLMWWQLGVVNDLVVKFRFNSLGRVTCTDGVLNYRM